MVSQIKSNPVSYSVFALARLFLEKPERYEVNLTAKEGAAPFYRLGETGGISLNREQLEENAFRLARNEFYRVDMTQGEPIKGNFPTVARCRLSGTVLGPTNHHAYQPKLRALYEQRFSRRMSFPEYQRQIEIVNDPAVVEQWKEEARNVTTFTTIKEEPAVTFSTRGKQSGTSGLIIFPVSCNHCRSNDRRCSESPTAGSPAWAFHRDVVVERDSFSVANDAGVVGAPARSRSADLSTSARDAFCHRRASEAICASGGQAASAQVQQILQTIEASRGIKKKELADKILGEVSSEDSEPRKWRWRPTFGG